MNKLSVSIVLYKTNQDQLKRCLQSLFYYSGTLKIYIVDNSPVDLVSDALIYYKNVEYVHCPNNPGFGSGHNIAISKSQSEGFQYHLVLNADVYFDRNVLEPMLEYMDNHVVVGQMMPKIKYPNGEIQRLCKLVPTPADLFFRRFFSEKSKELNNSRFELHQSGYDKIMFVPYLSGCFMLLRNNYLMDIGNFDERFFMYPEDIDLTRRMAQKYDTIFFPIVTVTHEHGAASHKSFKMFAIHAFNLIKYFNKWGWVWDPIRSALNKRTLSQFDKY